MSRASLVNLVGEENDLLSDTPVFQQAAQNSIGKEIDPNQLLGRSSTLKSAAASDKTSIDPSDKIDEKLMQEIEDYLSVVMQKNEQLIDMADNVIKSEGAQCVAAAIEFCE